MTESEKEDKELVDLLTSLTSQQTVVLDTSNPNSPKEKKEPVEKPKPIEEPKPEEDIDVDVPPPPIVKPEIIEPELKPANPPEPLEPPPADLMTVKQVQEQAQFKQLLAIFQNSIGIIVNNHKADREQIEEAIKYYNDQVRSTGGRPFVEGLAKLLEIKAEINTNATSVLDSISKLLAAGKGNDLIINIASKSGEVDLESLLSQPKKDDEK